MIEESSTCCTFPKSTVVEGLALSSSTSKFSWSDKQTARFLSQAPNASDASPSSAQDEKLALGPPPEDSVIQPPLPAIITRRSASQLLVKKTIQVHFVPRHPFLFTGGGFDPGNVFLAEGIAEFCSLTEFNGEDIFVSNAHRFSLQIYLS